MAEWRDILDRAADNLSLNLDQRGQASLRQQPASWPAPQRGVKEVPFVASRDLLARELEAISGPAPAQRRPQQSHPQALARAGAAPAAAPRASITQSIRQPALALPPPAQALPQPVQALPQLPRVVPQPKQALPRPAPRKSSSGRELAALSISVGIVVLSVYGFFVLLH